MLLFTTHQYLSPVLYLYCITCIITRNKVPLSIFNSVLNTNLLMLLGYVMESFWNNNCCCWICFFFLDYTLSKKQVDHIYCYISYTVLNVAIVKSIFITYIRIILFCTEEGHLRPNRWIYFVVVISLHQH